MYETVELPYILNFTANSPPGPYSPNFPQQGYVPPQGNAPSQVYPPLGHSPSQGYPPQAQAPFQGYPPQGQAPSQGYAPQGYPQGNYPPQPPGVQDPLITPNYAFGQQGGYVPPSYQPPPIVQQPGSMGPGPQSAGIVHQLYFY